MHCQVSGLSFLKESMNQVRGELRPIRGPVSHNHNFGGGTPAGGDRRFLRLSAFGPCYARLR